MMVPERYSIAFKYAGLQYTSQCFCDDSFGKYNKLEESKCNAKCPKEQQQSCGGTWRNSVYDTDYLGESKRSTKAVKYITLSTQKYTEHMLFH